MGPLWNEMGDLVTWDMEKAEVLNDFFCLSLHQQVLQPHHPNHRWQRQGLGEWRTAHCRRRSDLRPHLRNLKMLKSMGSDEVHPQVPRELADEVAKPLSIMFEKSWQCGEGSSDWKRRNTTPFLKRVKRKTQGTTGESTSPLCLARSWSRSSCKLC